MASPNGKFKGIYPNPNANPPKNDFGIWFIDIIPCTLGPQNHENEGFKPPIYGL